MLSWGTEGKKKSCAGKGACSMHPGTWRWSNCSIRLRDLFDLNLWGRNLLWCWLLEVPGEEWLKHAEMAEVCFWICNFADVLVAFWSLPVADGPDGFSEFYIFDIIWHIWPRRSQKQVANRLLWNLPACHPGACGRFTDARCHSDVAGREIGFQTWSRYHFEIEHPLKAFSQVLARLSAMGYFGICILVYNVELWARNGQKRPAGWSTTIARSCQQIWSPACRIPPISCPSMQMLGEMGDGTRRGWNWWNMPNMPQQNHTCLVVCQCQL